MGFPLLLLFLLLLLLLFLLLFLLLLHLQRLGVAVKKGRVTRWVATFLWKKYPETSVNWGKRKNLQ
jgi:hypothetical protein